MGKRKTITKKLRFEVFKRDNFTCQYCGHHAPDVILEVDHIVPVAEGGDNEITNLITSCFDCNRGKGKRKLTENQEVSKQQEQLKLLSERKEQLEMIAKWKIELLNIETDEVNKILDIVQKEYDLDFSITATGKKNLLKIIKKYGFAEVLDCALISFGQYKEIEQAFTKIGAIANVRNSNKSDDLQQLYYIRGIAKNRFNYCDPNKSIMILKNALSEGATIEELKQITLESKNWSVWRNEIENRKW